MEKQRHWTSFLSSAAMIGTLLLSLFHFPLTRRWHTSAKTDTTCVQLPQVKGQNGQTCTARGAWVGAWGWGMKSHMTFRNSAACLAEFLMQMSFSFSFALLVFGIFLLQVWRSWARILGLLYWCTPFLSEAETVECLKSGIFSMSLNPGYVFREMESCASYLY